MTRYLNDDLAHAVVFVEIVFRETQFLADKEVCEGPTVSTKIASIDEEICAAGLSMVENHGLRHGLVALPKPYNALSIRDLR